MICSKCGAKLNDGVQFCICGSKNEAAEVQGTRNKSDRKIILLIAYIIGALPLLRYLFLLTRYSGGSMVATTALMGLVIVIILAALAVIFNISGWRENRAKPILIAAILYTLTLVIPSAVLCWVGFYQLKKEGR